MFTFENKPFESTTIDFLKREIFRATIRVRPVTPPTNEAIEPLTP